MLASVNRLTSPEDFRECVRKGARSGGRLLVVHLIVPSGTIMHPGPPRAGFVVSKAVGGAVVRNRVKRRLRHLVRPRLARIPQGSLLVVRAQPAAATASFEQLGAELDGLLERCLQRRHPDQAEAVSP